jgi:ATP-binding cassette subfamily F protein uup
VSHDRAFLDNVVTQSIAYEGDAKWREYVGGYSDWVRQRSAASTPQDAKHKGAAPRVRTSSTKLSFRETRELEALPAAIAALESEQAGITAQLGDSALYRDEPGRVQALQARYTEIEAELMRKLARWEALEAKVKDKE